MCRLLKKTPPEPGREDIFEKNHLLPLFNDKKWADVKCGDVIFLQEDEFAPADLVVLMSSASNGECFV